MPFESPEKIDAGFISRYNETTTWGVSMSIA